MISSECEYIDEYLDLNSFNNRILPEEIRFERMKERIEEKFMMNEIFYNKVLFNFFKGAFRHFKINDNKTIYHSLYQMIAIRKKYLEYYDILLSLASNFILSKKKKQITDLIRNEEFENYVFDKIEIIRNYSEENYDNKLKLEDRFLKNDEDIITPLDLDYLEHYFNSDIFYKDYFDN